MRAAKLGAHFVWVNRELYYPRSLAAKIGRRDLNIVSPDFFTTGSWHGLRFTEIVVDHAVWGPYTFYENLNAARLYIRRSW